MIATIAIYALILFPLLPLSYTLLTLSDLIDAWLRESRQDRNQDELEMVGLCCCSHEQSKQDLSVGQTQH